MQALLAAMGTHPCIFVVGKGGVGKTTTAGAIALAAADAGQMTHLVTTDPAESLSDLFQTRLPPGRPVPSPCTDRLTLEVFDARAWGDGWLAPRRAALAEVIELGTYLERADVDGLLERTVPGVDEAMGALRIGRLAAARRRGVIQHVVVDTAPTGHTLRLLDARASLGAWLDALRTMAAKADVVASSLLRTPVRLKGELALDEIEQELDELDSVLSSAAFVIVDRSGSVVRAETGRLAARLRERGLRVLAFVRVGDDGTPADPQLADGVIRLRVPLLEEASGCEGLRRFADAAVAPDSQQPDRTARQAPAVPAVRAAGELKPAAPWIRSAQWRVIWFAGKGGVGKSTCAAAAAVGLAGDRPVSLYSTDPAGSLSELFERDIGREAVPVTERLRVQQVAAEATFTEWLSGYRGEVERVFASLGLEKAAQLDRRVVDSLFDLAPPGIDEIVSLDHIMDAIEADETLVIDTAPSGHFLRLLEMPELALDWTHGLMRILLRAGVAGSLDALSERMLAFAKRLKSLRAILSDATHTAVFVVTLDEPMVQAETDRLRTALRDAGIAEAGVIMNRARRVRHARSDRTLLAPELATPPVGVPALRTFFDAWEFA